MTRGAGHSRRDFLARCSLAALAVGAPLPLTCARVSAAERKETLTELSATAAVAAMRAGEIKAEDYAAALLAQAERWKSLNAFRTLQPDSVLEAARAADKKRAAGATLGVLHGLPIPVKDSVNTRALPTSNGTKALQNFRPAEDADVLRPLFAQGAILMGKTNLHELSMGWSSNNQTFGAVLNPYDQSRTPGGSSGGSAAAVAARMAALAVAEDTWGSIRVPATFCGLAGLRSTFGRYPAGGMMSLAKDKFDQVGPLARSVQDLVLFDSVVTGTRDAVTATPLTQIRIGISPSFHAKDIDPETGRIVDQAIDRLKQAGATIVRAELPPMLHQASVVVRSILAYEGIASLGEFLERYRTGVSIDQLIAQAGSRLAPVLSARRAPGPQEQYRSLLRQMEEIKAATIAHFREHRLDAIAFSPTLLPAVPQGDAQEVQIAGRSVPLLEALGRNIGLGSCAGLSCLVLPAGMTSSGLPVGLELDGPPGSDRKILALGLASEKVIGAVSSRPAIEGFLRGPQSPGGLESR
jgi:indoleacetamide hydrolase